MTLIDHDAVKVRFAALAESYKNAAPFPHAVISGLVPLPTLRAIRDEVPPGSAMRQRFANDREVKYAEDRWSRLGPVTRDLISELMSAEFLEALTALTGVSGLISDTRLIGGGLHRIEQGGKLNVHADFNIEPLTGLHRRLNLLVYLNPGWSTEWNGQLELWTQDMSQCAKSIEPEMGTAVIFSTTSTSFHGHPEPLLCPPDVSRLSLALYYYTVVGESTEADKAAHSTVFVARPGTSDVPTGSIPGGWLRARIRALRTRVSRRVRTFAPPRDNTL